jgi:hypothetical protein
MTAPPDAPPDAPRVAGRLASAAPLLAALVATAVVVGVVLAARPGGGPGPVPPEPVPPAPVSLDQGEQSLDRCGLALAAAGVTTSYPPRREWRSLAVLFTGDAFVTLLDGPTPFVCATGPRTVQVSDPSAAVPVGPARLLLTTSTGVVAAVAPARGTVAVGAVPTAPGARYFLGVTGAAVTRPDQLAVTVGDPTGTRVVGAPDRLAPPALELVDRPWEEVDGSVPVGDLLARCAAAAAPGPPRQWRTAHVLAYRGGERALLIAVSEGTVGGCSLGPAGVTPLRTWRVGLIGDGDRPFTWLPRPGETLPDLEPDVAAGPLLPGVVRLEVTDRTGRTWDASVAGGTFATQVPAGVAPDAAQLTVRASDAGGRLLYEGPAAG